MNSLFSIILGASLPLSLKKKKIVHVQKISGIAGSEIHIFDLLIRLDKSKHDIWFLALVHSKLSESEEAYFQQLKEAGINIKLIRLRGHIDPLCFVRLNKFINEHAFDIVHSHLIHGDIFSVISGKINRVPVIISTRHNDNPFRKNIILKRFLAWLYSQTTMVITVSHHLAEFCQRYEALDADKIRTIHHGISLEQRVSDVSVSDLREQLDIPLDAFVCLSVGRLIKQKGHKYLIEAIPSVLQQRDIYFVIVGDGPLKNNLMKLANKLGVAEKIRFAGWQENVTDYYQMADFLVHPSLWEGFGIVLIEALNEGLPILASNVGAIPEIISDLPSSILIDPMSSDSISRGILQFWDIRSKLHEYKTIAETHQEEKFDVSSMILKIENLYADLFDNSLKTRIAHIITGLDIGGAENMLIKLIAQTDHSKYLVSVISLSMRGVLAEQIENSGVPVHSLDINPQFPNPFKLLILFRRLRSFNPDLVQTWMYHGDFLGGIIARLAGNAKIVWNIRNGTLNRKHLKFTTFVIIFLSSLLSRTIPQKIASCSLNAMEYHKKIGYQAKKMVYLPNGFELERFRRNKKARKQVREELSLDNDQVLIGMIARYHPQKDYKTFLAAANMLSQKTENVRFALVGTGLTYTNSELAKLIGDNSLQNLVYLLGERQDPESIYAAFDIFTLCSSFGEGFPNVIGEAMACEIPVVATRDGDVEHVIGEYGVLVNKENPAELANNWLQLLSSSHESRRLMGKKGREHIANNYEISNVANQYMSLYESLLNDD